MTAADDKEIARLRAAHPAWEIWYVPTAAPPWIWCAKRLDDQHTTSLINVHSATHLNDAITEAEHQHHS